MGRQNESTNCGEKVCRKTAKTSLIDVSLAYSIGKSYSFASLGIVPEVSGPESDPKCGSASVDSQVDALFRIRS